MTLSIRQQLVGDTAYSFGRNNKKRYLTIHETGNPSPGANAAAHANLQSRPNPSEVAWHWQVDDREAVQSFTHDFQLWHAGDGSGDGNLNSISIETCIHEGIDWAACKQNLVELAAQIVTSEGIPLSNVVQHNHWSGKDCPTRLRADGGAEWRELYNAIAARVNGQADPPSFGGDAASYVGKQIDIDEWWNYKTANDAEQLVNKVRVMPAGRYTVTKVNGQTPHLVKDDNKASGWVQSSVLADRPVVGSASPAAPASTYTVVRGDTLHGIAQRHGTTWQTLQQLNGIQDANVIFPGLVLQLP